MKNILIISYFFPPCIKSGSQRAVKMALNLPKFSWNPVILTASRPRCDRLDEDSLSRLKGVAVFRTKEFLPFKNKRHALAKIFLRLWRVVSLIDHHVGWIPFAYREGMRIIKSFGIDAIFVTGYPFSSFYIGYLLNRRTGIPYFIDYRDPWLSNPVFTRNRPKWLLRRFEKKCLEHCALYFAATPLIVADTGEKYKNGTQDSILKKGKTFTYSFDRSEFPAVLEKDTRSRSGEKVVRLLGAGAIYDDTLFERLMGAFRHLQSIGEISARSLEFVFYGKLKSECQVPPGLHDIMQLNPFVPRQVFLEKLNECDGLILAHGSGPVVAMCYPGRMFEFFAVQKPILYLGPRGIAAETIERLGIGLHADSVDAAGIARQLTVFIRRIKKGDFKLDMKNIGEFESSRVMQGFVTDIEEIYNQ